LAVPLRTSFAETEVPLGLVQRIDWRDGKAEVQFQNGDRLKGTLGLETFSLATICGDVPIATRHVRSIAVLSTGAPAVSYLGGNALLVCREKNGWVEEIDPKGTVVWRFKANTPYGAEKLANGNVLIAGYGENRVIEVDRSGQVVWQYSVVQPLDAKALPNGNILVSSWNGNKVVEVRRDKTIAWSFSASSPCGAAQRLTNGNTLIGTYASSVIEVTPGGRVVWQWKGPRGLHGMRRLPNGNTLVALAGKANKVIELTPEGKVFWEYAIYSAVDAFRLPNGNTLISSGKGCREVTLDKKVVWKREGFLCGSARK
jgi:hypothetical protein